MQAIILAAGKGSRLGDMTKDKPKSFVEIEGKKLIEYNVDMLTKYGIDDIVIVTGHMYNQFESLYSDREGIRFVYNPFYDMTNVLGSFWCAQELLKDDFIYMHADTLCDTEIFEELLEAEGDIVLPVDFGPCDEEAMKVKLDDKRVVEINKTMDPSSADGEFIGVAKISKSSLLSIKKTTMEIMKKRDFSAFFEVVLQKIISDKLEQIETIPTRGKFWCEIDFKEDYDFAAASISDSLRNL